METEPDPAVVLNDGMFLLQGYEQLEALGAKIGEEYAEACRLKIQKHIIILDGLRAAVAGDKETFKAKRREWNAFDDTRADGIIEKLRSEIGLLHYEYCGQDNRFKGQKALVQISDIPGYFKVQFDNTDLRMAFGWHDFPMFDFKPLQ